MSIRVGTVVNIMKVWNNYQVQLASYKDTLAQVREEGDPKKIKYWEDTVRMTEDEMGEYLNVVI